MNKVTNNQTLSALDTSLLSQFKLFLLSHSLEKSTYKFYTSDIRQFLIWRNSKNKFGSPIDTIEIKQYLEQILRDGISMKSLNRRLSSFRKFDEFMSDKALGGFMKGIGNNRSKNLDTRFERYIEHLRLTKKNQKTLKNYLSDLKQFSSWLSSSAGGQINLHKVNEYLMTLTNSKSPASIKRSKSTLYQFLAWLSSKEPNLKPKNSNIEPATNKNQTLSPSILFIIAIILISQFYLPVANNSVDKLALTDRIPMNLNVSPQLTNQNIEFTPSKTKIILTDSMVGKMEEDRIPFVVDEVDYSMIYSDPDISVEAINNSGSATLPSASTSIEITSPLVRKESIIQITPTSSTKNKVLYILKQKNGSFTVAVEGAINEPIHFVWTLN